MLIGDLSDLSALILAVSLATERLVVVLKTIFPRALAVEREPVGDELPDEADRGRRLTVMAVAYLSALVVSILIAGDSASFGGVRIPFYVGLGDARVPVPLLALLASGGSALWNNVVGFTGAVKDIRRLERRGLQQDAELEPRYQADTGSRIPVLPKLP